MFKITWNRIIESFGDKSERQKLLRSFNNSAKRAFISGEVPTLLKASISRGKRAYKHQLSDWLNSGFKVQAFSGRQLSKDELVSIGQVIIADNRLVRKLVTLGFDTLEICDYVGVYGYRWQLKDYIQLTY